MRRTALGLLLLFLMNCATSGGGTAGSTGVSKDAHPNNKGAPTSAPSSQPTSRLAKRAMPRLPSGSLPPQAIDGVISAHGADLAQCKKGLTGSARITMFTRFVIDADGRVREARVEEGGAESPRLARCLLDKLRSWRFPQPTGGVVHVVRPFAFVGSVGK